MVLFHRPHIDGQNASQSLAKVSYVVNQNELGSPEMPMTRLPPLAPTGSALYLVVVRSMPPVAPEPVGKPDAPVAGDSADEAAGDAGAAPVGLGDVCADGEHAATTMTPAAITLNRRFRIQVLLLLPLGQLDPESGSFCCRRAPGAKGRRRRLPRHTCRTGPGRSGSASLDWPNYRGPADSCQIVPAGPRNPHRVQVRGPLDGTVGNSFPASALPSGFIRRAV